ncbi:MAG TPA: bifunctional [glutamate--ammonia ligase]-adenylyl-L-tyrosine phosphorylase/[glutamate--ammonia-ligase] adenylyltransferase [Verrucomicrobiae bacterium]|nr:bifunctional [glutamate--ammonia ligase]-adenylyl-L-tyrosine phosphorylase/[glutamate--ammonia-ligase] adenylyltransferase [Verrucomicrobiae bacterium]
MKSAVWPQVIKASADPERVQKFLDLLNAAGAESILKSASAEQARILAALLSGSQFLGNELVAHPDWLSLLDPEDLKFARRAQGLRQEVSTWLKPLFDAKDFTTALAKLREFKQREMLRIAARDLARLANVSEIIRELSDVADVILDSVWRSCLISLQERFGSPWQKDDRGQWQPTEACVLGMGKLGGQELNYSSDVDVLFVYSDEGQVFKEPPAKNKTPRAIMANHQFFNRVAEAFIAEISRTAPEGMFFRIDLRLRPEGDAGPLCRSLASYENYYAQWGQTWERMMLIKARGVAGSGNLAGEFLEMVQPFRYPRAVGENVLREIGAMKDRIEAEVVRAGELERNVKLGRGGIREIEFIAQSQQLLHAGKQPFLQGSKTVPALEKLAQYKLFPETETRALADAYVFLRDVEHRLQMEENLQTHTIPNHKPSQERLAKLMGFENWKDFDRARAAHSHRVAENFNHLFRSEKSTHAADFPREFSDQETEWKTILAEHSFRDPDNAFQVLREFAEGPGYVHVSSRTIELAHQLLPKFFALCPKRSETRESAAQVLSDPDRVITRLDSFIAAYGARAVLFELWNSNPTIFELLLKLFDRSEFLAELAIRTPDMVDELVTSGRLRQRKTSDETLRDLRHGLEDKDQSLWLRRYHQVELMRIGLRDILGLADPEQYLTELSALADACLQYAVEVVMRRHKFKNSPVVVIGLGKLGGSEIDYGSDLDIIFVADSKTKNLRKLQPLAVEVMELLSERTELGIVFQTDARLRPDGEKGLLVNTLDAYEEYYRTRAQLWEIQSLTRTRAVAGNLKLGERFQNLAAALTNFAQPDLPLSAFSDDWKIAIHKMRMRIEKERTPAGKDDLAIKTGQGGLVDAEFIAQALCLENGWHEANTLRALEQGRASGALADAEKLIANYRELRRVEGILRRWSYEGETVLPDDAAAFCRVSVRCGFTTQEKFSEALKKWRTEIRQVYRMFFGI